MVLLADNWEDINDMVQRLEHITSEWGMRISVPKTKILCTAKDMYNRVVKIRVGSSSQ